MMRVNYTDEDRRAVPMAVNLAAARLNEFISGGTSVQASATSLKIANDLVQQALVDVLRTNLGCDARKYWGRVEFRDQGQKLRLVFSPFMQSVMADLVEQRDAAAKEGAQAT